MEMLVEYIIRLDSAILLSRAAEQGLGKGNARTEEIPPGEKGREIINKTFSGTESVSLPRLSPPEEVREHN